MKEHDGRFFEYFSSVHIAGLESSPSGDDVDGNRNHNHTVSIKVVRVFMMHNLRFHRDHDFLCKSHF